MRFLRPLLLLLAWLAGLAVLLLAIAFSPPVQEWAAKRLVTRYTGAEDVTLDSASLGFSSVSIDGLQVHRGTAVLAVPSFRADVPLKAVLAGGPVTVSRLTAHGWIYDATGRSAGNGTTRTAAAAPKPAAAGTPATPATRVLPLSVVRDWLKSAALQGACESLETDGDIVLPGAGDKTTTVHVVLKGGALAAGRTGEFDVDATIDFGGTHPGVRAQGDLRATLNAAGQLDTLTFKGRVGAEGIRVPADLNVAATLAWSGATRDEHGSVTFRRGEREVATATAMPDRAAQHVSANWRLDLREADVPLIAGFLPIPISTAVGSGTFATSGPDWRAQGTLKTSAVPIALNLPNPAALRTLGADVTFAVSRTADVLEVAQLTAEFATDAPVARVKLLQPCRIDPAGHVQVADPHADALAITVEDLPLAWLSHADDAFRFTDGTVRGALTLQAADGAVHLRGTSALTAAHVVVRLPRGTETPGLDLTASVNADAPPGKGWTVHLGSLAASTGGRPIATGDLTFGTGVDEYGRHPVSGSLQAQFGSAAAAPQGDAPAAVIRGGTLEFSGNVGLASDLTGRVTLLGTDPSHTIAGEVTLGIDDFTAFTLRAPLKLGTGASAAELAVAGKWTVATDGPHVDLQLSSPRVASEQLTALAACVPGLRTLGRDTSTGPADAQAFWHPLVGRVRFDFGQVTTKDREWWAVGGTVSLEPDALRLSGGRAKFLPQPKKTARAQLDETPLEPSSAYSLEGALTFNAGAPAPYQMQATGSVDVLTTARLLGWTEDKPDAAVEGHWSVTDTMRGTGRTIGDLLAHREDQTKLESSGGTLRLLRTNITDAIPDEATPVSDTFATLGAAAGRIFGGRGNTLAGQRKLPAATEALLNFTYQTKELAYEKLSLTATRDRDGTLRLSDITIMSANERITGSGIILNAPGRALGDRPLALTLDLAFRGIAAERLATGGVARTEKGADGFTHVTDPVPFGGTLAQIDAHEWHDRLARAAAATLPAKKK